MFSKVNFFSASAVALFSFGLQASPFAQYQQCQQILGQGFYNQMIQGDRISHRNPQINSLLCNAVNGKNQTGLSIEQLGETVQQLGYKNIDRFKRKQCPGPVIRYNDSEAAHILIQTIDQNIVGAWSDCIKDSNDGMALWGNELGEKLVELTLDWKGGYGKLKHLKFNYYNLKPVKRLDKSSIELGTRKYMFVKINPDEPAYVVVNGETRYREHSWSYNCPGRGPRNGRTSGSSSSISD